MSMRQRHIFTLNKRNVSSKLVLSVEWNGTQMTAKQPTKRRQKWNAIFWIRDMVSCACIHKHTFDSMRFFFFIYAEIIVERSVVHDNAVCENKARMDGFQKEGRKPIKQRKQRETIHSTFSLSLSLFSAKEKWRGKRKNSIKQVEMEFSGWYRKLHSEWMR